MAKQIKNRREDLYINEVPPEILDEATLSADGFVKNTDYATATNAGVVKGQVSNGIQIGTTGFITASTRSLEQYSGAPGSLIIGKGTFENVVLQVLANKMSEALGTDYSNANVGTQWIIRLHKLTDGPGFNFDMIV